MNINTPQTYCVTAELNVLHGIAPQLAQKHLQLRLRPYNAVN